MDDRMMELQRLVADQRFRQAAKLLETEALSSEFTAKWKSRLERLQVHAKRCETIGGITLIIIGAMGLWWLIGWVFINPYLVTHILAVLVAIITGFIGWYSILHYFTSQYKAPIAALITIGLMYFILDSGLLGRYYLEPPLGYVFLAFILTMPAVAQLGWLGRERAGKLLWQLTWKIQSEQG